MSIKYSCEACSQKKLTTQPSITKVNFKSSTFLQRIQGYICGSIHPTGRSFRYFMVLVYTSCRWSHICILSTRNVAFIRLLAQIIKLSALFPEHTTKNMKKVRLFTSKSFGVYSASLGIKIEHLVLHIHTQNGLIESLIKRTHIIA